VDLFDRGAKKAVVGRCIHCCADIFFGELHSHADSDITAANHGMAETSAAAHASTSDQTRERMRGSILAHIRVSGEVGATCDEVEMRLSMPHQTASARISEMLRGGLIRDSGDRRRTRTGKLARVYTV
jgi:hypothetical protein